ncbi:MAG: class I SAM-dependent methyltransferase [Bacteroidia bacterium]
MDYSKSFAQINKESWNKRTEVHFDSEFYDNKTFIEGRNSLNDIELQYLQNIKVKSVLHLQCHFGQDTISMSRMGASKAVGVDLSNRAVEKARELATTCGTNTEFICCNVYDLPKHLNEQFDIVFTSYGTISWLPDINKWAALVNQFLKPGGQFVFAEFHPAVWMMDEDFKTIKYRYFNSDAIVDDEGTYTDGAESINTKNVSWNHGMAEVIGALLKEGLTLKDLQEFDFSPYDCFSHTEEFEKGKFRIKHLADKLPMVYSLLMEK